MPSNSFNATGQVVLHVTLLFCSKYVHVYFSELLHILTARTVTEIGGKNMGKVAQSSKKIGLIVIDKLFCTLCTDCQGCLENYMYKGKMFQLRQYQQCPKSGPEKLNQSTPSFKINLLPVIYNTCTKQ